MLGQETPIQGLLPGQLSVILEIIEVEYIFYANQDAAEEHEMLQEEEADILNIAFEGTPSLSPSSSQ